MAADGAAWLATVAGQRLLADERPHLRAAARRFHGDAVLWLGCTPALLDTASRCLVRTRFYATPNWRHGGADAEGSHFHAVAIDPAHLPFASRSVDGTVLHHVLETAADQRTALREAVRVLRPGGRLLVLGLNPASLWQLARPRAAFRDLHPVAVPRLYEWLAVLGMEREASTVYLNYRSLLPLALRGEWWQRASRWLGARRLPVGGSFLVSATKVGHRLIDQRAAADPSTLQPASLPAVPRTAAPAAGAHV